MTNLEAVNDASSRDRLETAIWRLLADYAGTIPDAVAFMTRLLALIDAYAVAETEAITRRRDELHAAGRAARKPGRRAS